MARSLSEHGMIAAYFAPLAAEGGLGLVDDAACMTPSSGHDLVMTVDAVVAGIHFLPDDDPRDIAVKVLAVNISDLAAKGAEPKGFLLTLGLGADWSEDWLSAFAAALGVASKQWRCPLYGGDTVRANGAPFLSLTAFGEVPCGQMVKRGGAQIGDMVCVSGTIGDGALGLKLALGETPEWGEKLTDAQRSFLLDRYRRPQPRLALAPVVLDHAHAAMDISDGLIGDFEKLLQASGVSAAIDLGQVPLSEAGRAALAHDATCLQTIMTGGDDYEILCAIPAAGLDLALAAAAIAGVPLQSVGQIVAPDSGPLYGLNGKKVHFIHGSFSHF